MMATKSNPEPKNATPVKLQLKPPNLPRLPFSSPMGEEILSPTSPNSRTPPQDRLGKLRAAKRPEEVKQNSRGLALDTPSRDGRERRKEESPGRPGLNIVTNFPPRTSSAQKISLDGPKKDLTKGGAGAGVGSTKEKASNGPYNGHVRQASSKSLKSAGSKSRLDILRRVDSKVSNLSPSDRAVVIGISLPQDEVSEHAQSAISPEQDGEQTLGTQLAMNKLPSHPPSIVVTPAGSIAPWSTADEKGSSPTRPRVRSSVYSQGPGSNNIIDSSIVPPVPALPPEAKHNNLQITTESARSPRVMSTCTVFDEEADPSMGAPPDSAHSQLRILKRSSTDTLATRPRSQGWWNSIMSPFWPKSPMHFKAPPLPSPKRSPHPGPDRNTIIEDEDVSPVDEKSHGSKSSHTSWTDSPIAEESEKPALTFDQILPSRDCTRSMSAIQPEDDASDYPFTATRFEGLGAAAEYFEACIHDMHDPTPFFECQNHRCLPREFEANGIFKDELGEPSSRVLLLKLPDKEVPRKEKEPGATEKSPTPPNRFSAAFREADLSKASQRPASEATVIEDLDETPDVHKAHVAPVVRAPEPISMAQPATIKEENELAENPQPSREVYRSPQAPPVEGPQVHGQAYRTPPPPPPPAPPADDPVAEERPCRRYIAVPPPETAPRNYEQPKSPTPPTPGAQTQGPGGALPLRDLRAEADASRPTGDTYLTNHNYHPQHPAEQTSMADFFPPPRFQPYPQKAEADDEIKRKEKFNKEKDKHKKEELTMKESKSSMSSKLPSCCSHRKKDDRRNRKKMTKKKKRLLWLLTAGLVAMIILILLLAMLLHRRGDSMPVQTQWLNITGYPPIPTGVSTIVQPNAADEVSGCVNVPTMWSCALPKEQQQSFSSGAADQPNFRIEIRFENGTNATSSINSTSNIKRFEKVVNPVSATSFIRHHLLQLRSSLPSSLFSPSPSPPSQEDQTFLGNTTDDNHAPFDGEYTPFFMSFDSPVPLPSTSRLAKRDTTSSSPTTSSATAANTSDPFPNLTSAIPAASTNSNGTAAPANLYPFPSAQPLRLFDRGLSTEHYGFYTYFDRSIFLKSSGSFNGSITDVPDDANGGSLEDAAKMRCTWAQTRFLVQVWTNKGQNYPLLPGNGNDTAAQSASPGQNATTLANSSANDLSRPGSFPYPVTITLDRHGGDIKTKEIYCYGLDDSEEPENTEKKIQLEDRGFQGTPVNPASGPFATNKVSLADGGPGWIDGGSGGCSCKWQNWK